MESKESKQAEKLKTKKIYAAPKMQRVGEVRDLTKGDSGLNQDGATHRNGGPPSQPAGQ